MLNFDRQKCVECKQCLQNCPQLEENFDLKFLNCNQCNLCIDNCPKNAMHKIDEVVVIDYEKCNNCMKCVEICSKKAIVVDKRKVKKCNLCFDQNEIKCIKACSYNAISLKKSETLGWKIIDNGEYRLKRNNIQNDGIKLITFVLNEFRKNYKEYDEFVILELIEEYCNKKSFKINGKQKNEIIKIIQSEISGFSILDELLKDPQIEEISIDEDNIFVYHKEKNWIKTNLVLKKEKIIELINKMGRNIKRRITSKNPMINSQIENGRIHAIVKPIAKKDTLTIRLFSQKKLEENDFYEIIPKQALNFLKLAVKCNVNLIITGNTGSGKTTLLDLILGFLGKKERIITVEETPELKIQNENNVTLIVNKHLGIGMSNLVTETLRMRPDRVVVGEVRHPDEVKAFVNTMLAGQGKGSFATFHSENSEECLIRMKSLGVNEIDLHAIDLIIVLKRWTDNKNRKEIRKVTEISTIDLDYENLKIIKIFELENNKLQIKNLKNKVSDKIKTSYHISQKELEKILNV